MLRISIIVLLAGSSLLSPGCVSFKDTVKQREQNISVTSDPAGAVISIRDENGSRTVGQTPTSFSASYRVVERTYNKATCAMSGSAIAADIVDGGDGINSEAEAAVGLIAMVAGAMAGAATCEEADGVVSLKRSSTEVRAELSGYLPEQITVQTPKETPSIHFELRHLDPEAATLDRPPVPEPPAPAIVESSLAVFGIFDTSGSIDTKLLADVSTVMKTLLMESSTSTYTVVDADMALTKRAQPSPGNFDARLKVARDQGAGSVLDVRLVATESGCYLSASLANSQTGHRRLVASLQASCDEDGLFDAAEKIADLINHPPQDAVETSDTLSGE